MSNVLILGAAGSVARVATDGNGTSGLSASRMQTPKSNRRKRT
jgi:hypothetical protein